MIPELPPEITAIMEGRTCMSLLLNGSSDPVCLGEKCKEYETCLVFVLEGRAKISDICKPSRFERVREWLK